MSQPSPRVRIKRETKEWLVLKILAQAGYLTLNAFLPKNYPEAELWRQFLGMDADKGVKQINQIDDEDWKKYKKIFSDTLKRLKSKGYVEKIGKTKGAGWKINKQGKRVLLESGFKQAELDLPAEDGILRLFVFDIPETRKTYRDWIRGELIAGGYELLQRSVWLGKRPLREKFLQELLNHGLFECVHLFEVKERGTLKNLVS